MALGKRFYLQFHQGPSHSVILAPVWSALTLYPFFAFTGLDWSWGLYIALLAGVWMHLLLDWSNTFGIMLLYPVSKRRFRLDAVFFVDSVTLALTLFFYLGYAVMGWGWVCYIYPGLFLAYVVGKYYGRCRIQGQLGADFVIPSALNPVAYFVLEEKENGVTTYLYNGWTSTKRDLGQHAPVSAEVLALARSSRVFCDMEGIARALRITEIHASDSGTEIQAADLAVRNFGGKFGATRLRFDEKGKILDEVANI